ncbi:uncharacterized protein MONBRDRAFT_28498 [Monosiga brevicollis MX1]|uniref:VPS9 domain-containing protein n=1 Tax=Monosiga brevicollis TaxID=81824 RepID=A9V8C2_MONBE|nr:uncharacterized protein MONBRDRAFT_28498 [Monosiga brevicollis MX1]EDQ86312.1 predicted protein [Monosiga brevicollis MX1]|eukprot:XP_001748982.1 hypothetical protein [Monosiga brevicollis MX1]
MAAIASVEAVATPLLPGVHHRLFSTQALLKHEQDAAAALSQQLQQCLTDTADALLEQRAYVQAYLLLQDDRRELANVLQQALQAPQLAQDTVVEDSAPYKDLQSLVTAVRQLYENPETVAYCLHRLARRSAKDAAMCTTLAQTYLSEVLNTRSAHADEARQLQFLTTILADGWAARPKDRPQALGLCPRAFAIALVAPVPSVVQHARLVAEQLWAVWPQCPTDLVPAYERITTGSDTQSISCVYIARRYVNSWVRILKGALAQALLGAPVSPELRRVFTEALQGAEKTVAAQWTRSILVERRDLIPAFLEGPKENKLHIHEQTHNNHTATTTSTQAFTGFSHPIARVFFWAEGFGCLFFYSPAYTALPRVPLIDMSGGLFGCRSLPLLEMTAPRDEELCRLLHEAVWRESKPSAVPMSGATEDMIVNVARIKPLLSHIDLAISSPDAKPNGATAEFLQAILEARKQLERRAPDGPEDSSDAVAALVRRLIKAAQTLDPLACNLSSMGAAGSGYAVQGLSFLGDVLLHEVERLASHVPSEWRPPNSRALQRLLHAHAAIMQNYSIYMVEHRFAVHRRVQVSKLHLTALERNLAEWREWWLEMLAQYVFQRNTRLEARLLAALASVDGPSTDEVNDTLSRVESVAVTLSLFDVCTGLRAQRHALAEDCKAMLMMLLLPPMMSEHRQARIQRSRAGHPSFELSVKQRLTAPWPAPVATLKLLGLCKAPWSCLRVISKACKQLEALLALDVGVAGADDMLPVLIHVIAESTLQRAPAIVQYCNAYGADLVQTGEGAYWFGLFEMATQYLCTCELVD